MSKSGVFFALMAILSVLGMSVSAEAQEATPRSGHCSRNRFLIEMGAPDCAKSGETVRTAPKLEGNSETTVDGPRVYTRFRSAEKSTTLDVVSDEGPRGVEETASPTASSGEGADSSKGGESKGSEAYTPKKDGLPRTYPPAGP